MSGLAHGLVATGPAAAEPTGRPRRILLWHVHGSWTTAFVQGRHDYLVPVTPDRGPDGLGRARTWDWPASVREVTPAELRAEPLDLVLLQRPHEEALAYEWTGRRPGRDIASAYVEHNTPRKDVPNSRHPYADRADLRLVHVTHFNDLFWDAGRTRTTVIEHGVVDPGERWTGELARAAVVINEPIRRGRVTGTDLLARFAAAADLDVFGMGTGDLASSLCLPAGRIRTFDLPQQGMHDQLALRRVYLHPIRWTSLGLSLIEAMHLGMPVVALATTEAVEAVPPGAGVLSTSVDVLTTAVRRLLNDREEASHLGKSARAAALERYGLGRFLADWDALIHDLVEAPDG